LPVIRAVTTSSFRNLEDGCWQPTAARNILLGENGSGKTSLLEAAYLGSTTRSFRTNHLPDCARHGAASFHVALDVVGVGEARLEVGWAEGRARHLVNDKLSTLGQHLAYMPVLAWTAAEAELLTGGPELRRRFIDRALVGAHPPALAVLARYRRIVAQKRRVLAAGVAGVEAWNQLLAEAGAEVIRLRAGALGQLRSALKASIEVSGLAFADLELRYCPSPAAGESGPAALASAIERLHQAERQRGAPLVGPHRDDVQFLWRGHDLRRAISAGERKALGLALVAAQGAVLGAVGRAPLFLLDDADAELDRRNLGRAWSAFPATAQVLATSNRPEVWAALQGEAFWRVSGGQITPAAAP
jgi:DNA replication and repair protein RecF